MSAAALLKSNKNPSDSDIEQAMAKGTAPLRSFMLAQTHDSDIEAIYAISHTRPPERPDPRTSRCR